MKIINQEIKIKKTNDLTTQYVESALKAQGLNVVRWAIISTTDEHLVVSASVVI